MFRISGFGHWRTTPETGGFEFPWPSEGKGHTFESCRVRQRNHGRRRGDLADRFRELDLRVDAEFAIDR